MVPVEEPKLDAQALVNEAATKAAEQIETKAKEAKAAEDLLAKDKEALIADYEAKIKASEEKALAAEKIANEAITIGETLIKEKAEAVARIDNPFAEQAKKMAAEGKDPLADLTLAEVMKLKLEGTV